MDEEDLRGLKAFQYWNLVAEEMGIAILPSLDHDGLYMLVQTSSGMSLTRWITAEEIVDALKEIRSDERILFGDSPQS